MSGKDKDKSLQSRLKQYFKYAKNNSRGSGEYNLTEDKEKELRKDSPIPVRIKAIKELTDTVINCKLDETSIAKIWGHVQDLLLPSQQSEYRHTTFNLLQSVFKGQHERLGILRESFFQFIIQHEHKDDTLQRFELLQSLTDNGKVILHFELEVGPFLLAWFPEIIRAGKATEFMLFLENVIKFHAVYIDEVITGFVQKICDFCCNTTEVPVVKSCLEILNTIVAYSNMPKEALPQFIGVLCRTVNGEKYSQISWRIMRTLLGTHLGHSTLFTMCRILQEPLLREETSLLRGAVFFIKMGLWGGQAQTELRCPHSAVLPSLLCAARGGSAVVAYEIVLAVQSLVTGYGRDLQDPCWDVVLMILGCVVEQLESSPAHQHQHVASYLHETLSTIEMLIERGSFNGNLRQFYNLVESCSHSRPEKSVLKLITYLAQDIIPTKNVWLSSLYDLLGRYYKQEQRTAIRLKALEVLNDVVVLNKIQYEDELIDKIVTPYMFNVANDNDTTIRSACANLLIELCLDCESKGCYEMFEILEKLLNRPFEIHENDNMAATETETKDTQCVVKGLIRVFTVKIHKLPSQHAIRIYNMLVNHIERHYITPKVFENCNKIRLEIFDCFLKMRADNLYRLGCSDSNNMLKFSPYLCVTYKSTEGRGGPLGSPPPASPAITQQPPCTVTYVSIKRGFTTVVTCLNLEKDWDVLNMVLDRLPKVLENKAFILSKQGNEDIYLLVDVLHKMISTFQDRPVTSELCILKNKTKFHVSILSILAALASYHAFLEPKQQQGMIFCLYKYGLIREWSRECIIALTTCTLEMQEVMVKMLPKVLLTLSKISAVIHIAIPILEFLSTLTILPTVFASFVADQYMAVFAISLPYTNPFKFNHYTVSLAHHVIAVWFLKCRLPFRKDFVRFITNGLQTNARTPFEEPIDLSKLNQDSSDRKRSSSLTEGGNARKRERTATVSSRLESSKGNNVDFSRPSIPDKKMLTFYEELTETCIDLMARYTFSPCSALPRRLPTAEFLLSGGQSMSWLMGNRVITVTTSGCAQKALRQGLCDKCWSSCKDSNRSPSTMDDVAGRMAKSTRNSSHEMDDNSTRVTRQNSSSNNNTTASSPIEESKKISDKLEQQLPNKLQQLATMDSTEKMKCACWCQGWAEIHVRRPTGDMSWVMRIQNQTSYQHSVYDFPLSEVSALCMPTLYNASFDFEQPPPQPTMEENNAMQRQESYSNASAPITIPASPKQSPSRQSSRDSIDEDLTDTIYDDGGKYRNPVRRSNSSPEMSANWKNPIFAAQQKQQQQQQLQQQQQQQQLQQQERSGGGGNNGEELPSLKCPEDEGAKAVKGKLSYTKDMRVSCEAIPEEIAGMGTTPPTTDHTTPHPTTITSTHHHPYLLTSLSCPSSTTTTTDTTTAPRNCHTVPVSPLVLTMSTSAVATGLGAQQLPPPQPPLARPTLLAGVSSGYNSGGGSGASLLRSSKSESTESVTSDEGRVVTLLPVIGKPPQSPTQTSPRLGRHGRDGATGHEIQKSTSFVLDKTPTLAATNLNNLTSGNFKVATSENKPKDRRAVSVEKLQQQPQQTGGVIAPSPLAATSSASTSSSSSSLSSHPQLTHYQQIQPYQKHLQQQQQQQQQRDRGYTVSVMIPNRKGNQGVPRSGISPSFVFLQLFHNPHFGNITDKPLLVNALNDQQIKRALNVLDSIPPYETHKIGVLYVGQGQSGNESEILRNKYGSVRYVQFLQKLGTLIKLQDVDPQVFFLGGLEEKGTDGTFAYIWQDDVIRVMFHVATLMPIKETDPLCNNKKSHIGNNNVTIVYNESGEEYNLNTLKGQFNFAAIIVQPLDHNTNKVTITAKEELVKLIGKYEPKLVSDQNVAILARQLALHANLASLVFKSINLDDPYASNWLERLRKIKHLRSKVVGRENNKQPDERSRKGQMEDFTYYT